VVGYRPDLVDLVRFRLRELLLRHIDWISLDLPLSHPRARQLCERIEALGFFFAGVILELVGDDVLSPCILPRTSPRSSSPTSWRP